MTELEGADPGVSADENTTKEGESSSSPVETAVATDGNANEEKKTDSLPNGNGTLGDGGEFEDAEEPNPPIVAGAEADGSKKRDRPEDASTDMNGGEPAASRPRTQGDEQCKQQQLPPPGMAEMTTLPPVMGPAVAGQPGVVVPGAGPPTMPPGVVMTPVGGLPGQPPQMPPQQQQQPPGNPNEMPQQLQQQQQEGWGPPNLGQFGAGHPLGQAVALREMQLAQLGMSGGLPDGNAAAMQQHLFNQQLLMAGSNPFGAGGHHQQGGHQLPMGFGGNPAAFGAHQLGMASFLPQGQQQRFPGQGPPQQQGGGMPGQPPGADGGQPQPQGGQQQPPQPGPIGTVGGAPPPPPPPGGTQVPGASPPMGGPHQPTAPGGPPGAPMPGGAVPTPGPPGGDPAAYGGFGGMGPRGGFLPGMGGFPPGAPSGMPHQGMPDANSFQQMMALQHHQAGSAAGLSDPMLRQRMMLGMPPGGPGGFRPSFLAAAGGRLNNMSAELRGLANLQPLSPAMSLSLACDDEHLSEYQIMVRKQLEVFEAQPEDVESNTQGRKKQVALGQVGIRCKHCASLPLRQRGRGAVYYPAKLQGVYQAAQNMASSHLCESCQCIDEGLKGELKSLRERRDTASGGKQYWADGARALGLVEAEDGLRLTREGATAQPQP
jgi:hypothetical protein